MKKNELLERPPNALSDALPTHVSWVSPVVSTITNESLRDGMLEDPVIRSRLLEMRFPEITADVDLEAKLAELAPTLKIFQETNIFWDLGLAWCASQLATTIFGKSCEDLGFGLGDRDFQIVQRFASPHEARRARTVPANAEEITIQGYVCFQVWCGTQGRAASIRIQSMFDSAETADIDFDAERAVLVLNFLEYLQEAHHGA